MSERVASGEYPSNEQPDLASIYGEKQVELFGMTGTLTELEAMCPVDLSDPQYSNAKNNFVIKALNEAGASVEPEHEALFSERLEALGIERNFSVEPPKPQEQKNPVEEVVKTESIAQVAQERVPHKPEPTTPVEVVAEMVEAQQIQLQQQQQPAQSEAIAHQQATDHVVELQQAANQHQRDTQQPAPRAEYVDPLQNPQSIELPIPEGVAVDQQVESRAEVIEHKAPTETTEELLGEQVDTQEPAEEIVSISPREFEELLYKESGELYDAFSHALELTIIEQAQLNSDEEKQPVPPIATNVVERLAELPMDEQEAVAQDIQNIVGALHGLLVLEARQAEPEAIAAVEEKLAELCVTLFEELDIEYTEQDVQDFVLLLQQPAFQSAIMAMRATASKELGTHEAKYFGGFAWTTADIKEPLHRRLGIFTLSCSGFHHRTDNTLSVKKFVTSAKFAAV